MCESLFAERLEGSPLVSNARHLQGSAAWMVFQHVLCERWYHKNIVLIGDAAHTAHFSIGSGTKLAMEDALTLARVLVSDTGGDIPGRAGALSGGARDRGAQAAERRAQSHGVVRARRALRASRARAVHLQPADRQPAHWPRESQAARRLATCEASSVVRRTQRRRSRRAADVHAIHARGVSLKNRVVVLADGDVHGLSDGMPNDFHLVHFGARAMGGAAMVFTEMTCVSPDARITPKCLGLWNDEQRRGMDDASSTTCTAGRRQDRDPARAFGAQGIDPARVGRHRSAPATSSNWPLISASPLPYIDGVSQTPCEATNRRPRSNPHRLRRRDRRAALAGFDWLELHCAHGYLLSSFISPLTNQRPTNSAARSRTDVAIRSRCSRRCARCGPRTSP